MQSYRGRIDKSRRIKSIGRISRRKVFLGLALLAPMLLMLQTLPAAPARAAGTVGSGTAGSCTEAALVTALGGGGAVTFNCGASPVTITVTSQKTISFTTAIDGGGLVTLSGGGTTRVLSVTAGIALTLTNVTVANGKATGADGGGGVYNSGTLNVINSTLYSNTSTGNAGGVQNNGGTVNIVQSTFFNNSSSSSGGALYIGGGTLNVINSTFYSNTAAPSGFGGAVYSTAGTLTYTNSTIAGNSANQGGGLYNAGLPTLTNMIIANNTATVSGGNCAGSGFTDGGGNLRWPSTEAVCIGTFGDPKLGPLANNGGATMTMGLGVGSAAITHATANCPATDQRGVSRPGAPSLCDSGAYQSQRQPQAAPNYIVNDLADTDDGSCDLAIGGFNCTLREAIKAANAAATNDKITFVVNGTITLGSSLPNIVTTATAGTLTIDGAGQAVTVSGNNAVQVISVNPTATLTIQNLTVANGKVTGGSNGGGVESFGALNVANVTFTGNSSGNLGGGLMNNGVGAVMTVTNSTFYSNTATNPGGAIANAGSGLTVTNSTFFSNSTASGFGGGAFYESGGSRLFRNTIFSNNPPGNCFGTPTDGGGNLQFGDASCGVSTTGDPKLQPFANNGGSTFTLALGAGSAAIGLASANCPAKDQRGFLRPGAPSLCDSGAYQRGGVVSLFLPLIRR